MLIATSWTTTVNQQLASPDSSRFYHRLARRRQVILYGRRGVGESERNPPDITLGSQIDDLQCVLDACGIEGGDLLGDNDGCYVAVAFAAAYPERVRRIALWAPLVGGHDARPSQMREFARLMRTDWTVACKQWATWRLNDRPEQEQLELAAALAAMTSPEIAAAYVEREAAEDIAPLLRRVTAPALVLNTRRGGARSMGVAEMLSRGRFEAIDVDPDAGRLDFERVADVISEFFDQSGG
jgi:pimeloyl-ACP methyl ester carboxylesterase